MSRLFRLAAAMAAASAALLIGGCGGGDGDDPPPTQRATTYGAVAGLDQSATTGTYAWLGVPYAQPPVGELRWAAPVEPQAWTGVRPAQEFGHSCAQGGRYFSPAPDGAPYGMAVREGFGKPVGEEDCLTLNIWRPADAQANLPVILFIHGGSNISGYTADPSYHGEELARRANAVVVTVNYRLGFLGWLDLPQLKTGDAQGDSGNFALLDLMQALRFVRDNIAAFGGDPSSVTVMGHSAGAVNTWALVVSPLSAALLQKAAPLSGGIAFNTQAAARTYGQGLLEAFVIADGKATDSATAKTWLATQTNAQVASWLRGLPADELVAVMLANPQLGNARAAIEDGTVLPVDSRAAVAAGNFNQVPLLVGNTRDEGTLFANLFGLYNGTGVAGFKPNDYDRFGLQFNFDPDAPASLTEADLINAAYLPVTAPGGWNAMTAVATQGIFLNGLDAQLDSVAAAEPTKTWYYRFAWDEEPVPFNTVYGATHGMDVPFMFHNFGTNVFSFAFSSANAPGREALSDAMVGSLAAFARTGDPNHAGLGVTWPNWPDRIVFDASPTQAQITVE